MKTRPNFSALLQACFTERLMAQCNASPHTIASYRDTFRLLLEYAQPQLHKSPSTLALEDLDAPFKGRPARYRPDDQLLAFLQGL